MSNNQIGGIIFLILIIVAVLFVLWFFIFKVKHLKTPDVYMVDGGVKTGKSLVTVMLAVKQYKKNVRKAKMQNFFIKTFNKTIWKKNNRKLKEIPMLYSNMPLFKVKYNPLTMDILLWKVRIPHKSVCIIDEATLLADSMTGMVSRNKNNDTFNEVNETLTLFLKTYGHQTHGGSCFYNSQNVTDLHFSFRRCTAVYLMVMRNKKYPLFSLLDVRELAHDESNDIINVNDKDIEVDNRPLFVSHRWYKYYDRFYLDILTKYLNTQVNYNAQILDKKDKKELDQILTLGSYKKIKEFNERHAPKQVEVKQDEKK